MKKSTCVTIGITAVAISALLGACGKTADTPEAPAAETVENAPEETPAPEESVPEEAEHVMATDISGCDTFTQIVDKLEDGKGYANANIDGTDVLLISSGTYDNMDGKQAAIDAEVFGYNADGAVEYLGYVESGGTAYPLTISDGKLLSGGNHFMCKSGITDGKLVTVEQVLEEYDSDGKATYHYSPNEGGQEDQDKGMKRFEDLVDLMMNGEVIDFQPVGGGTSASGEWLPTTEGEARELCPKLYKVPEGAQDVEWTAMAGEKPEDPVTVKTDFKLMEGERPMIFCAMEKGNCQEDENISGLEYDWNVVDDGNLTGWGGVQAKFYRYFDDTQAVDLATWFDVETGAAYCLYTTVASLDDIDGFDIQAIVEQMYNEENDYGASAPDDFLQEQSGLREFADYDEVIAQLKKGQGYAYIRLTGYEGDLLAVTEQVFEADNTAAEAAIYAMEDGKAKNIGNVFSNGSAYPLRCEDGIIYTGDMHTYESSFISASYGGIMVKDYVQDGVNEGNEEYTGFLRETNDFDHDKDFTGGKEEFQKLIDEREKKKVIEFTAVK